MASPPEPSTRETGRGFPGHRFEPGVPATIHRDRRCDPGWGSPSARSRPVAGPRALRRHDDVRPRRREPVDPSRSGAGRAAAPHVDGRLRAQDRDAPHPRAARRYGIKTCIFIPGWIVERYPALCEEILKHGHEVGHHGYLHEKPFFMKSREEEEELLLKSLAIFKKVLGVTPLGSRTPSADPSRHTMELLAGHGFVYHSNALDTDLPYCHQTAHGPLVEFPTAWC